MVVHSICLADSGTNVSDNTYGLSRYEWQDRRTMQHVNVQAQMLHRVKGPARILEAVVNQ